MQPSPPRAKHAQRRCVNLRSIIATEYTCPPISDPTRDCNPPPSQKRVQRPTLAHLDEAKEKPRGDRESTTTSHTKSIQQMKIEYPLYIDSFVFALATPEDDETEVLIDLFSMFAHQHVIEAYKDIQKRRPDLYPPLLEE